MPPVRHNPQKWGRNASQGAGDYEQGTRSPRRPWAASAAAAEASYGQAVQEAISRGAFAKGINRAGDAAWTSGVAEKGVQRYRTGVLSAGALAKYDRNFGPFRQVIESVQLPPRGPKGTNGQRSELVGQALLQAKRGRT